MGARVKFCVKFCAVEEAEGDDVEPEEERDASSEGAVDLRVVGEARDVPTEGEGGEEPREGGESRAGNNTLPGLLHGSSHVIDEADDTDASGKSDRPTDEQRNEIDRCPSGGHDVFGEPLGN